MVSQDASVVGALAFCGYSVFFSSYLCFKASSLALQVFHTHMSKNYKVIRRHRSDIHEIFMLYNKSFIDQACSVKMAGYQPRFSLVAIYKNAKKKRTQSIPSHTDLTLGQKRIFDDVFDLCFLIECIP